MIRILGIALLSMVPIILGFSMSKKLSSRITVLRELKLLIAEIREQIRYSNREICPLVAMICEKNCYSHLPFLKSLVEGGRWNPVVPEKELLDSGLYQDDVGTVSNFFEGLGVSDIEGQISHCELYFSELSKAENEAERMQSEKGRLYRTLGVIAGIGIAILLI